MNWIKFLIPLLCLLFLACPELPEEVYDNPLDPDLPGLNTPALIFFPDSATVNLGFTVSVDINVKGVSELSGAYIEISYDATKLSLLSYSEGDLFQGAEGTIFFFDNDPVNGIIQINTSYLGNTIHSVDGTGKLATLNFTTTLPGVSFLQFSTDCELLDPDDISIPIEGFGVGVIVAE